MLNNAECSTRKKQRPKNRRCSPTTLDEMKKMKRQRTCIFCNKKGDISKEHFWPQWLGKYFPQTSSERYISEFFEGEAKAPKLLQNRTERQGKVITKKIRVVCKQCNNEWMSAVEEKVKPIIVSILEGSSHKLNRDQIATLSFWATVKAIVGEHAEDKMALTPSTERYLIYKHHTIPDYFRIFLGMHASETKAAYSRHSATISLIKDGLHPPSLPPDVRRNIQTVTFLVGPLLLHVVAVRVAGFNIDGILNSRLLVRLWPPLSEEIDLLSSEILDDNGLRIIAGQLETLISSPRIQYGGPLPANF
jgi:hypothetical protein